MVFTDNEEKTLARCKEIAKMGLNEENARETVKNLLDKEERAKTLYVSIDIASDRTYKEICEKLNERLANI